MNGETCIRLLDDSIISARTSDNAWVPEYIFVLCSCGSEGEAEEIAAQLVSQRLAACVSISAPVRSIYRWEGKVESAQEWVLTIKTLSTRFDEVSEAIHELHSYELPEIVALTVAEGSRPYLRWISESVHA